MVAQQHAARIELTAKAEAYVEHHRRKAVRARIEACLDEVHALIEILDRLDGDCDFEAEDEHGGDVQDEPHDQEPDGEPTLGWTEGIEQGVARLGSSSGKVITRIMRSDSGPVGVMMFDPDSGHDEADGDMPGGTMIAAE